MSFYNQDVKEGLCQECFDRFSPYINKYGAHSPCITCKDGSNRRAKMKGKNEKANNHSINNGECME